MKLTICQFGKLFLLLTAFFFVTKSFKTLVVDVAAASTNTAATLKPVTVAVESSVSDVDGISSPSITNDAEQDIERKFEIVTQQATTKSIINTNNKKLKKLNDDEQHQLINKTFNVLLNKAEQHLENILLSGNENQTTNIPTTPSANILSLQATKLLQHDAVNGLLTNLHKDRSS